MPKQTTLIFIAWNLVLSGALAWSLFRSDGAQVAEPASNSQDTVTTAFVPHQRDSGALKEARIAFFRMDSLRDGYELIKERDSRFISEGRRLESGLQAEQERARQRYQELMAKDQTYSTKAEVERDEAELRNLMEKLQGMQADGEERLARMEAEMLKEIAKELDDYLKEYNTVAGYDYILSVQGGGQVWVGNEGLDITKELVAGLNARHRARKTTQK